MLHFALIAAFSGFSATSLRSDGAYCKLHPIIGSVSLSVRKVCCKLIMKVRSIQDAKECLRKSINFSFKKIIQNAIQNDLGCIERISYLFGIEIHFLYKTHRPNQ